MVYSYFRGDVGIDCRMVLCSVFGMFCALFVACFLVSIGRILWPMEKGCSRLDSSQKLVCTGAAKELFGTLVRGNHAIAWLGSKIAALGYAIAWVSTQLRGFPRNCVAPAHFQASTSDDHNIFVQTSFWVFFDSMESPSSLESIHI